MKTSISADGTLVIQAETHLESFALRKWSEDQISDEWYRRNPGGMKFMLQYGEDMCQDRDPKGTYISLDTGRPT